MALHSWDATLKIDGLDLSGDSPLWGGAFNPEQDLGVVPDGFRRVVR